VFLACGLQASWGFALLGPNGNGGDVWQTAVIGYDLAYLANTIVPGGPVFLGDIGGPKNIGEGYRRNAPVLYYTYDANFLDFFGSNGVVAADSAFAVMNNLTNVSSYSSSLSEFPLQSQHFNFTAQSDFLTDLKSVTLHLLVEQLGLAQPERFTWTLHERFLLPATTCPTGERYTVVQRNFDFSPTSQNQIQYSSYVNDVLYTYLIIEDCTGPDPLAFTEPFAVDPAAEQYTAVAANNYNDVLEVQNGLETTGGGGLQIGGFYTGLTRDDVSGLRYLLQANNINLETAATGSQLLTTNIGSRIVVSNLDFSLLSASALTNDPVTLAALFPNLIISSVTTNFIVVCTPNIVSYLTNFIGSPVGTPPVFVVVTNGSNCAYQPVYTYSFANVITNNFSTNSSAQLVTTTLGSPPIGAPVGSPLVTNTTSISIVLTNVAAGDYFIIPAGDCGLNIVANSGVNGPVTLTTNLITTVTNTAGFVYSQSIVTAFTNRQFLARPVICGTGATPTGLYEGIENVKFARADFDSLVGQFFQPITNVYTMVLVTNSQPVLQHFQRVVTQPDILLSANDQAGGNTFNGTATRNINFNQGNIGAGLAGPGVINSPETFSFNKIGLTIQNLSLLEVTNAFLGLILSEFTGTPSVAWASFDSSTNDPVVYPNGNSIQNLQNQIIVQISPVSLPNGTNNSVYTPVTFTATGGAFSPPFTWTATGVSLITGLPSGTGLPPGLTLSSGGTLSGTPTQSGTFDFTLQLSDSLTPPRTVQWSYSITIQ
jgi:hypothetical protein